MNKTLVALALIFSLGSATLADITLDATTGIASTTAGYMVYGAATNEKIGKVIARIGDFDGDGIEDYAVATQTTIPKVYIIKGKARTAPLDLSATQSPVNSNSYTITLPSGYAVTSLAGGDVNGDQVSDVVIGVAGQARVYVAYGKHTDTWATWTDPAPGSGAEDSTFKNEVGTTIKGVASSSFGASVAVGQFGSDDKADIVIGFPGSTDGGICIVWGKAHVKASGPSSGASTVAGRGAGNVDCASQTALDTQSTVGVKDGLLVAGATGEALGSSVAVGKDLNGDGKNDLFVASASQNKGYLFFGGGTTTAANAPATLARPGAAAEGYTITGPTSTTTTFGQSAAFIGDFNDDDRVDLAIGNPAQGSNKGQVHVIFGQAAIQTPTVTTLAIQGIAAASGITISGADTNGYFGYDVDSADVNDDGNDDLIVGAPLEATPRAVSGAKGKVFIIYGSKSNNAALTVSSLTSSTGITITGPADYDFGVSVAGLGATSIGGDAADDFIVGAPAGTKSAVTTGIVYEFRGQKIDTPAGSGSGATLSASLLVLASFFVALMF